MENKNKTASQRAKDAGLYSLNEASQISGVSIQTLINWAKNKPQQLGVLLLGCAAIKNDGK